MLWTISQLASIIWVRDDMPQLLCKSLGHLIVSSNEVNKLSLRIIACRTLSKYLPFIGGLKIFESLSSDTGLTSSSKLIKSLCEIAQQTTSETLPIPL